MYLLKQKIRGMSIPNPFAIELEQYKPELHSNLPVNEAVPLFLKLVIKLAGQYAKAMDRPDKALDYLQEGILGVYDAYATPERAKDHPFDQYVMMRIHRRISRYIEHDQIIRTPESSIKQCDKEKVVCYIRSQAPTNTIRDDTNGDRIEGDIINVSDPPIFDHNLMELKELIDKAIESDFERDVVNLRQLLYNDIQIAQQLNVSKSLVWEARNRVRMRFEKLLSE